MASSTNPKSDIVEIASAVDDGRDGLGSFEVVDDEGTVQVVKLGDPIMLSPPA